MRTIHGRGKQINRPLTDTSGIADQVFAPMDMLEFRFALSIRDVGAAKLYLPAKVNNHPALSSRIGGSLNIKRVRARTSQAVAG